MSQATTLSFKDDDGSWFETPLSSIKKWTDINGVGNFDLAPGDTIRAFVRRNPDFRPTRTRRPVLLIGAGTGIGPLAGFVRAEGSRRPVHLWFGAHSAETDLLYAEELTAWQKDGRLDHLAFAFSRSTAPRRHVQDALRDDADHLRAAVLRGARIMVCGGRDMAAGVTAALNDVLQPLGITVAQLKADERHVEDVY